MKSTTEFTVFYPECFFLVHLNSLDDLCYCSKLPIGLKAFAIYLITSNVWIEIHFSVITAKMPSLVIALVLCYYPQEDGELKAVH